MRHSPFLPPPPKKSRPFLRASFGLLLFLVGIYLTVGLILNPLYFRADWNRKVGQVKGVISVRVIDVPEQPVVTATPGCLGLASYVDLAWNETLDTTNYDIERDTLTLVSGLADYDYRDATVADATSYDYRVIAQGPRGTTPSEIVTATTYDCATLLPPECTIISIGGKAAGGVGTTVSTTDRSPLITGTTNLPNADITIVITGPQSVFASVTANPLGAWSWNVPTNLALGNYQLSVTATDPLMPFRTITTIRDFHITSVSSGDDEEEEEEEAGVEVSQRVNYPPTVSGPPLALGLEVMNPEDVAYAGGELSLFTEVTPKEMELPQTIELVYRVYSSRGDILHQEARTVNLSNSEPLSLATALVLPPLIDLGRYTVAVETVIDGKLIVAQASFEVRSVPIFTVGNLKVTWSGLFEIVSWSIFGLLILVLFFSLLFLWEHHRSTRSLIHITEEMLARKGYFGRRKEVSR